MNSGSFWSITGQAATQQAQSMHLTASSNRLVLLGFAWRSFSALAAAGGFRFFAGCMALILSKNGSMSTFKSLITLKNLSGSMTIISFVVVVFD